MAFRIGELDGKVIVVIDDCQLAAAVKSLDYAWQETPDNKEYLAQIVAFLTDLYAEMARTEPQRALQELVGCVRRGAPIRMERTRPAHAPAKINLSSSP